MSSHDKLLRDFERCQKRFASTIEDLEQDLERMKENDKVSQTLCNKRDAQIETMVNFNNSTEDIIKLFLEQRDKIFELGKLPPQAIDLEEAIIGAVLLQSTALQSVISFLKPEHFYYSAHNYIFQAVLDLHQAGDPVDMRTVVLQLRKRGWLGVIGGAYVIAEITDKVSSSANVEYHARCIIEFHIKRKLILLSGEMKARAYDDTSDVFELMDLVNEEMKNIEEPLKLQSKLKTKINGENHEKQKTT